MKANRIALCIIIALLIFLPSFLPSVRNEGQGSSFSASSPSYSAIFDVRTPDEYDAGHIKGSISLPISKIFCNSCMQSTVESYYGKKVAIYCGSNEKAGEVALKFFHQKGIDAFILGDDMAGRLPFEETAGNQNYATGCVPLEHYDVEEREVIPLSDSDELPSKWDWRDATYNNITGDWTTPVKNQGSCGSCWDFAAMGALEAIINIRTNNPAMDVDLSEQYLLSCPSGGGCSGWNAYWAYSYLLMHGGAITEDCFPYEANDRILCSEKCPDWMNHLFPIVKYGAMRNRDRDEIKDMVVNFGPVVAEMAVYGDFGSYTGGVYEHPGDEPVSDINHQVVIVGYDDDQECWIVKNSWGSNWGENGFFRIAYGDCQIEHEIVYADFSPTVARAGGPYFSTVGRQIQFDGGQSRSYLSTIASYSWDFGDGTTGKGRMPLHAYSSEGKFVVHLTVTDAEGNQGVCKTYVYIDSTPPSVEIQKPGRMRFYYFNDEGKFVPSLRTIVIGSITVLASASDNISGLEKVEMYIDDTLVYETDEGYIKWDWNGPSFGFHVLELKAYDTAGNVGTDKVRLFIWV